MTASPKTVALVGNPNSGKTSLFNQLTGLNQKVGNFPGVTVDKKTGVSTIDHKTKVNIIDLPGTYSLYAKSSDEKVVTDILTDPQNKDYPDILVVIADASNLKRNLLLLTQSMDLGIPTILVLNMMDLAERMGKGVDLNKLSELLEIPVVAINARRGEGIEQLKNSLLDEIPIRNRAFLDINALVGSEISKSINKSDLPGYTSLLQLIAAGELPEE